MDLRERTILVADDEQGMRRLVVHQLREIDGVEILQARNGLEARRILETREVDLVITDLLMPELDGLRLMRWAQRERPGSAWIVLSGLETFGTAVEAIQLGAFDFLTKPPEPERMRISVRNALAQVRMEQERRELVSQLGCSNDSLQLRVDQLEVLCDVLERQAEEIARDLQRAETIQRALLPDRLPPLGAFRFETLYRPGFHVGGDLYDIVPIDERYVGLLIADACGHGMSAAMLSVLFRRHLRMRDDASGDPVRPALALAEANTALIAAGTAGLFVTAAYALLDTETGEVQVSSAGHPPVLWAHEGGEISAIERTGPALGVEAHASYGEAQIELERGDRLLLFTDGVLGVNGAGLARVGEVLQHAGSLSAILSGLREGALAGERNDELDDATAVVVEARVGVSRLDQPTRRSAPAIRTSTAELLAGSVGDHAWLKLQGRGSSREAEAFSKFATRALTESRCLTFDLSDCPHLDSTFLGTIHEVVCKAEDRGVEIWLQGASSLLLHLFDELSMRRVLEHAREGAEAVPDGLQPIGVAERRPPGDRVLRAHQALASLSVDNREEFQSVIESLRAEIERG